MGKPVGFSQVKLWRKVFILWAAFSNCTSGLFIPEANDTSQEYSTVERNYLISSKSIFTEDLLKLQNQIYSKKAGNSDDINTDFNPRYTEPYLSIYKSTDQSYVEINENPTEASKQFITEFTQPVTNRSRVTQTLKGSRIPIESIRTTWSNYIEQESLIKSIEDAIDFAKQPKTRSAFADRTNQYQLLHERSYYDTEITDKFTDFNRLDTIVPSKPVLADITEGPSTLVYVKSSTMNTVINMERPVKVNNKTEDDVQKHIVNVENIEINKDFKNVINPTPTESNFEYSDTVSIESIAEYSEPLNTFELKSSLDIIPLLESSTASTPAIETQIIVQTIKENKVKTSYLETSRKGVQANTIELKILKTNVRVYTSTSENSIASNTIKNDPEIPKILEPKYTDDDSYKRDSDYSTKSSSDFKTDFPKTITDKLLPSEIITTNTSPLSVLSTLIHTTTSITLSSSFDNQPFTVLPNFATNASRNCDESFNMDFPVVINLTIYMNTDDFIAKKKSICSELANDLIGEKLLVNVSQIHFLNETQKWGSFNDVAKNTKNPRNVISVFLYVLDQKGKYDEKNTALVGAKLKIIIQEYSGQLRDKLFHVCVLKTVQEGRLTQSAKSPLHNYGIIAGIAVSVIAGLSLIVLFTMLLVLKNKAQPSRTMLAANLDAYTLDSFGDRGSQRRKKGRLSLRSFLNQAFDEPEIPSHPLTFSNLTSIINNKTSLEEEFKKLPATVPLLEDVPEGAETKNRFSNVIPNPETRVILKSIPNVPNSEYINANFVKGYGGKANVYIATQAPLQETVNDFWRMIWEQQSRMILMLTKLEENGSPRCVPYFPDNTHDCNRIYGDFQVSLQSKDVREHFTVSIFRLYEMERNLFRDVSHLWYTSWSNKNTPDDPGSILAYVMETKHHISGNSGPIIVHCSPGTGRTGAIIALDILMKEYDESRIIDVQRCVARIRQDRHGAVHTIQQYVLIHEVVHEYILKLGTQSQRPSLKSLMSLKLPSLS